MSNLVQSWTRLDQFGQDWVVGPLPGGQWGSNVQHLKKKIAEAKGAAAAAQAVDLTDSAAQAEPSTKRIRDIEAELVDCPVQDYQLMVEQRDLLVQNQCGHDLLQGNCSGDDHADLEELPRVFRVSAALPVVARASRWRLSVGLRCSREGSV